MTAIEQLCAHQRKNRWIHELLWSHIIFHLSLLSEKCVSLLANYGIFSCFGLLVVHLNHLLKLSIFPESSGFSIRVIALKSSKKILIQILSLLKSISKLILMFMSHKSMSNVARHLHRNKVILNSDKIEIEPFFVVRRISTPWKNNECFFSHIANNQRTC